ncbi:MAG: S8 family peptidase [Bacteroidota bacterium]|nr:S8 family peptidase [Bacteroidota bacterium]MDX5430084.1 S8 family peptidase [Bacteroidota bacterium]MDX5468848.1 S8 family peptidase [Bacteroidota bacterium]
MKFRFFIVCFFVSLFSNAQQVWSPNARLALLELNPYYSGDQVPNVLPKDLVERYDLSLTSNGYTIGIVAWMSSEAQSSDLQEHGIEVGTKIGTIWTLRVPLNKLYLLPQLNIIRYAEFGAGIEPELERVRLSLRVDSVYMGLGDLKMPYTGKGVVVGIIDWGFDYTHPMFYDTLMQEYRITRAWDQNKTSGPAPTGYTFGTEYVGKSALIQAEQDTLYVFGPGSHGTHVGGIAGGGGAGTKYLGVAPEAELVFVSLKRDDASFIDAINYIHNYAKSQGKPYVVNMSFGNHSGPHDGSTLRNRAMDSIVGPGAIMVASAGNNGGQTFHLQEDFSQTDTLITEVPSAKGLSGYWGESVNIWADSAKSFSIQLELCDNQYQPVYQSTWFATLDNLGSYDTLYAADGDTLVLRMVSEASNPLNHKPNLLFESRNIGDKLLILRVVGTGNTHLWHVARLENRVTNWGQPFKAGYPGARQGDASYGISGPTGSGRSEITVASFLAEARTPTGVETLGTLSAYSSNGPTADERTKPDIAAPGENVASSVNSFDPSPGIVISTVDFEGKTYSFVRFSGTSMSAPATAGVVALMLQANPNLAAWEVKDILKKTARLDKNTGQIGPEGDLKWGWGKVNAYLAVRAAELKTGQMDWVEQVPFAYYPNPVTSKILMIESEEELNLTVIDMLGKEQASLCSHAGKSEFDLSNLSSGTYLLQWSSSHEFGFVKIVVP